MSLRSKYASNIRSLSLFLAITVLAIPISHAANPQSYTVTITSIGKGRLETALKDSSQLESLLPSGPITPFALIGRAQQDIGRLETVLQGLGYYQGKITITVDARALDDPDLPAAMEALPKETSSAVNIAVVPGPLYHLRQVKVEGDIFEDANVKLDVTSGDPAIAANVIAAQEHLLTALHEDGYALAKVALPVAYEDADARVLDVTYEVHTGPQVNIGEIVITGLRKVNERFVRDRLHIRTGERYSPSQIEKARQDLLSLGVFSGISVRAADQLDALGRISVIFDVQERLPHAVGFTVEYSTDLGSSAKSTWSHRNLFGNAEQLNLSAGVSGLGGSGTTGLGYAVTGQYIKPEFLQRDQTLEYSVGFIKQKLDAYDQDAATASVSLNRKFSDLWSGNVGISTARGRIIQEMVTRDYTSIGIPIGATYNSTGLVNPLEDPLHGVRTSLTVTPTVSFSADSATFFIVQFNYAQYIDLASLGWTAPGNSVIAFRSLLATAQGASLYSLPPDQRFYGGGSGTVRGFRYQSIGPQFPDGKPIGGTSIDTGTIEVRQRLFGNFGAVAFVDAGQVGASGTPFHGAMRVGTGIGMRYYTPIGPIRLDLAVPLHKQAGDDAFEIYIGLGQAF